MNTDSLYPGTQGISLKRAEELAAKELNLETDFEPRKTGMHENHGVCGDFIVPLLGEGGAPYN